MIPIPVTPMPSRKFLLRHALRTMIYQSVREIAEIAGQDREEFREIFESGPTSGEALLAGEEFLWRGTEPGRPPTESSGLSRSEEKALLFGEGYVWREIFDE